MPRTANKTNAAVESALAGISKEQTKMTRTFTSIIGMAPNPFYGTATEDVNVFVDEARRASTHNKWGNGSAAVCRLAYFLQGNAQYAFDAEVMDRVARKESDRRARQRRSALGVAASAAIGATDNEDDLVIERAAAREETLMTMLEPKRRILHTWEKRARRRAWVSRRSEEDGRPPRANGTAAPRNSASAPLLRYTCQSAY